ncbi:MAG: carbonic anhydrase [Anaerolineales bacterium]
MSKHITQAIVVHCMDFRLQKHLDEWLQRELGHGQYDRLSLAGGVFDLDFVSRQVALSHRLHDIKQVLLINHEDCGAYGEAGSPERHAADLRAAKQRIQAEIPGLEVRPYYLHLDGTFEPVS